MISLGSSVRGTSKIDMQDEREIHSNGTEVSINVSNIKF